MIFWYFCQFCWTFFSRFSFRSSRIAHISRPLRNEIFCAVEKKIVIPPPWYMWTYLLNALVSLTFLRCREDAAVGLSGGDVLALMFWLRLSGLLTGFGKTGGGRVGVNLVGAVGVLIFGGSWAGGANFKAGPLLVGVTNFWSTFVEPGFGATGGGIFVGGGMARASSLNGSG